MKRVTIGIAAVLALLALGGCQKQAEPAIDSTTTTTTLPEATTTVATTTTVAVPVVSGSKAITQFSFTSPPATAVISEKNHTISLTLPYGTNVTALAPFITTTGVELSPPADQPQDFSQPVTYTVKAANGTTQAYKVKVAVASSSEKALTSFWFVDPIAAGTVNEDARRVEVTVPYGTSLKGLVPTVAFTGASVNPPSGKAQDFSSPVVYTVVAADGSKVAYTVAAKVGLNPAKAVTSFALPSLGVSGLITESDHQIEVTVPYGTNLAALAPQVAHTGVSLAPASGSTQNLTKDLAYTVTAADGSSQAYKVTVVVLPNPAKAITAFTLANLGRNGAINEAQRTIAVSVPYGTSLQGLVPTVAFTGASLAPASGAAQDFSGPVKYTVTAEDGSKVDYTVTASVLQGSANADLKTLVPSAGTLAPAFSPATTSYTLSVPANVATLTFNATTVDAKAEVVFPAKGYPLKSGQNALVVTVNAENGTPKTYQVAVERAGDYTGTTVGTLKYLPAGSFHRDATAANVSTVGAFRLSENLVTMDQYVQVTGQPVPSSAFLDVAKGPVQNVDWYQAIYFCNKLSLLEGLTPVYAVNGSSDPDKWGTIPLESSGLSWKPTANWAANGYRLPTEMEWLWAAMGATDKIGKPFAGSNGTNKIGDYAWFSENSGNTTHPVGTKLPNEVGLYDMTGNLWQWLWDVSGPLPAGAQADYRGAATGVKRVLHGGGWNRDAVDITLAARLGFNPDAQFNSFGFRVARR